ncbi:hypothetical protein CCUS01_14385 [Colletotrichum cuscutae]|uniref:Uncharacterized protein n=1 Tax=Colletotrichum cuscutae TaxID=1209917 RepID=A0AAJ0DKZ8_9PEZI|nr:hypothetical protein CCUS01_14385 [Colletotrichum cuscutae]
MARHISSLTTFLDQYEHGFSDEDLSGRLDRMAILLCNPPYHATAAQPTRSRHQSAQKSLFNIRKEFGDPVYYLCLFVSNITTLSTERQQFNDALAQWSGKGKIPPAFTKQAQAIVERYRAEKRNNEERSSHTSLRKRSLSTPHTTQKSSTKDSGNASKRARLNGGPKDLMSVGRVAEHSEPGGMNDRTSRPGSEFNTRDRASSEVRNECGMTYQDLYINARSIVASQLATRTRKAFRRPEIETARREVEPDHQVGGKTIARCAESDDSDDEEDLPTSAPVDPINSVDTFQSQDGMTSSILLIDEKS